MSYFSTAMVIIVQIDGTGMGAEEEGGQWWGGGSNSL